MKNSIIFFPIIFILLSVSLFAHEDDGKRKHRRHQSYVLEHLDIDIDDDILVLTCEYDDDLWVEITPDYRLYISGRRVYLNQDQRDIVADYYDHFMEIMDKAKVIGKEGAKIGVKGAKLGVLAAGAALKLLFTDYDSDDLEDDIEEEAEKLEVRAEELEEMAEELEEIADEFEDLHYTMKREIEELDELDWF